MPTTVTHSIRASGGDYTTVTAWENGEARDLVSLDEIEVAEFYDDWPNGYGNGGEGVGDSNWNTDSTHYPVLSVAAGHRHDGTPKSGFFWEEDSGSNLSPLLGVNLLWARVEWIDIHNTRSSGVGSHGVAIDTTEAILTSVISRANSQFGFEANVNSSSNYPELFNCIAYRCGSSGYHSNDSSRVNYTARNCGSFNNSGLGFNTGDTQHANVINCVAYGNNGSDFSSDTWGGASDYNASGDTSASQFTNNVTGLTSSDFVDAANDDYHLASGSALIDAGDDLSGAGVTTDIDGEPRGSTWDIGPDEFVSSDPEITLAAQAQDATTSFSAEVLNDLSLAGQAQAATTSFSIEAVTNDLTFTAQAQDATGSYNLGVETDVTFSAQAQDATASISLDVDIEVTLAGQAQDATSSISLGVEADVSFTAQAQDASTDILLAPDRDLSFAASARAANASMELFLEEAVTHPVRKVSNLRSVPEPRRDQFPAGIEGDRQYRYMLDLARAIKDLQSVIAGNP